MCPCHVHCGFIIVFILLGIFRCITTLLIIGVGVLLLSKSSILWIVTGEDSTYLRHVWERVGRHWRLKCDGCFCCQVAGDSFRAAKARWWEVRSKRFCSWTTDTAFDFVVIGSRWS